MDATSVNIQGRLPVVGSEGEALASGHALDRV